MFGMVSSYVCFYGVFDPEKDFSPVAIHMWVHCSALLAVIPMDGYSVFSLVPRIYTFVIYTLSYSYVAYWLNVARLFVPTPC